MVGGIRIVVEAGPMLGTDARVRPTTSLVRDGGRRVTLEGPQRNGGPSERVDTPDAVVAFVRLSGDLVLALACRLDCRRWTSERGGIDC